MNPHHTMKPIAIFLTLILTTFTVACSGEEDPGNGDDPDAGVEDAGGDVEDTGEDIGPCEDESCFTELAAGQDHTCALDGMGFIHCWGDDDDDQLDAPSGGFETISAGGTQTCAIDPTNVVQCWRRGNTTTSHYYSDVSVGTSSDHICLIEADTGEVECGGHLIPEGTIFEQVSAGFLYSCGVNPSGNVECFAYEIPEEGPHQTPAAEPPDGTFSYVSTAIHHTCAIDDEDAIECWGSDSDGRLDPPQGAFVDVSLGHDFGCAIDDEGGIHCWGNDDEGALDAPEGRFLEVEAGGTDGHHVCAIDETHQIHCWGNDDYGQASPPSGGD